MTDRFFFVVYSLSLFPKGRDRKVKLLEIIIFCPCEIQSSHPET